MRPHASAWAAALVTCLALTAPASALAADGDGGRVMGDADRGAAAPVIRGAVPPRPVPWLTPNVQLQLWGTLWDQDEHEQADPGGYGDPELDAGFSIPRARFDFDGGFKSVDFRMRIGTSTPFDTLDRVSPLVDLIDAWMRVHLDSVAGTTSLIGGMHTIPFSREAQMSTNDIAFQERSVSGVYLAPVRDLGATIRHDWTYLGAAVGVFNGGGNIFGDADDGMMVAARLDAHVGGDTYRTNAKENAFGIGGGYVFNKRPADVTHRFVGDMLARIAGFTLFLEAGASIVDPDIDGVILPPEVPERTLRWGGQAQISWYGETKIGAVEPAVRFSLYDDAKHLRDNGDVGILHAGLTWREPVPFIDVGAVYIHRFELGGRDIPNDSVRMFAGLRYPSRRYAPVDLVSLFRRAGVKPLAHQDGPDAEADEGGKKGRKKR